MKIVSIGSKILNKIDSGKMANLIFYSFIVIYTAFLLFLSNKLVLSIDEPCSLNTTANSLSRVINLSYHFEGQPPAYFVILSLWRKIDNGIFFARLLSIIFILLSAFFMDKMIRLIFDKIYTKWATILFLLNPFTVWASLEIRLYSLLILLTIILIYLFYLIYFYNKHNLKIFFITIGLLGVYTQYYFIFLLVALSFLLLVSKGWRTFLNYCLLSVPIAILFLPNLLFISEQFIMHNNTQVEYTFYNRLRFIFSTPFHFLISIADIPYGKALGWILRIAFSFLLIISLSKLYFNHLKEKYSEFMRFLEIFISLSLISTFFTILYSFSNLIYAIQYSTIVFPFFCLSYTAFGIFDRKVKTLIYLVLVSYFILVLFSKYRPPFIKNSDSKSITEFIQHIERENEPILFNDKSIVLAFKQYYIGKNPLIPVPKANFDNNYFQNNLKDTLELNQFLNKIESNSNSFLLVTGNDIGFVVKKELTNNLIDVYLNNNFQIGIDTSFTGKNKSEQLRIRRLYKK